MPIDNLRTVAKRVLISGGNDKVEALLGGIRLINPNVFITNEATARALVDHP